MIFLRRCDIDCWPAQKWVPQH